jgi:hypothetical protein
MEVGRGRDGVVYRGKYRLKTDNFCLQQQNFSLLFLFCKFSAFKYFSAADNCTCSGIKTLVISFQALKAATEKIFGRGLIFSKEASRRDL